MQPSTTVALEALSTAIDEAVDTIDLAVGEPAASEDVREARVAAAGVKDRYERLIATLVEPERSEVQRAIGLKVAKVTGMLSRLES